MSSPLPAALRNEILAGARVPNTSDADPRFRCAHCHKEFAETHVQVDHITPEADGGSHDPLNLQVLCCPPKGAGCHRIKSRAEATARAKATKAKLAAAQSGTRPLALAFTACSALGAGVAARCTWLALTERPIAPFLAQAHHWLGIALLGVLGAFALAVLAHAGAWKVPDASDYADPEPAVPSPQAKAVSPAERMGTALAKLMGADIAVTALADPARPGVEGVEVLYGDGVNDHEDAERFKILERVNAKMAGRWMPTWDTEHNRVTWWPRPPMPAMIRHPGLEKDRPWYLIPIAEGVTLNLRKTSHVLVIGKTNSGKTSVMRSAVIAVIDSASRGQAEAVLIDPKRVELIGFRGWNGVREVVTGEQAMWDAPIRLAEEMDERYRLYEEDGVSLSKHMPIILVLDEYEEYVLAMIALWTTPDPENNNKPRKVNGEKEPPPIAAVKRILRLARKCGIHIILGTQRPDSSWFGGSARDNCQGRVGCGPLSPQAAKMLFERSDVGRDLPAEAKGRITYQMLDGEFEEAQSYWVPDPGNAEGQNTDEDWAHLTKLRGVPMKTAAALEEATA